MSPHQLSSQLPQPPNQDPKKMKFKQHLLATSMILAALTGATQASTINWGGAFFTSNYSADGTALESGSTAAVASGEVMYELGVFQNADGSEFTPSYANVSEWEARWVPFTANDATITSASSDYDSVSGYFGNVASMGTGLEQVGSVSSSATGGTLVYGFQAYVWGFDTKDLSGPEQPEWFLVTGKDAGSTDSSTQNWVVPDSSASNNASFDIQWDIASASEVIVGRIDNNIGGGEMVDPGPLGESDHQFATIPEPSSMLLTALAGLALLRRKRPSFESA